VSDEEAGGGAIGAGSGPDLSSKDAPPVDRRQIEITWMSWWRAIAVILVMLAFLWAVDQARHLVSMLAISLFFGLALVPGVNQLHQKRGWRRGAAVWFIYGVGLVALLLMSVVLIPAIVRLADEIGRNGTQWLTSLDQWTSSNFHLHVVSALGAKDAVATTQEFLVQWGGKLTGAAGSAVTSGISLVISVATIATFTFYIAADFARLQRGLLSWFGPSQQERLGWTIDQSITQVGGYLYSRLLLTAINGTGFFVTMVAVGMPVGFAIPLAIFGGFVSEFIPNIGTYLGGAIPIGLTLAIEGFVPALIVLAYVVVYQQLENYWLGPKISAKTMELNGGLAFGAALAGGALFGPMGAFMALPVAALISSFIKNYRGSHEVVYESQYAPDDDGTDAPGSSASPSPG
jgi:predicted PurR-regulated permease PerM